MAHVAAHGLSFVGHAEHLPSQGPAGGAADPTEARNLGKHGRNESKELTNPTEDHPKPSKKLMETCRDLPISGLREAPVRPLTWSSRPECEAMPSSRCASCTAVVSSSRCTGRVSAMGTATYSRLTRRTHPQRPNGHHVAGEAPGCDGRHFSVAQCPKSAWRPMDLAASSACCTVCPWISCNRSWPPVQARDRAVSKGCEGGS